MKTRILYLGLMLFSTIPLWSQTDSLKRFSVAISGGLTYFTENNDDETKNYVSIGADEKTIQNYYKDMATGYNLGAVATFRINHFWAMGFQYRFSSTSSECWISADPQDGIHLYYGKLSEEAFVNYMGLGIYAIDIFNSPKVKVQAGLSGGISFLRVEGYDIGYPYMTKGKHFMMGPSVGLEFPIAGRLSIVAEGSWYFASLKKLELITQNDSNTITIDEKKYYENISSISLSAGLKITL